jgi:hypothetical protein
LIALGGQVVVHAQHDLGIGRKHIRGAGRDGDRRRHDRRGLNRFCDRSCGHGCANERDNSRAGGEVFHLATLEISVALFAATLLAGYSGESRTEYYRITWCAIRFDWSDSGRESLWYSAICEVAGVHHRAPAIDYPRFSPDADLRGLPDHRRRRLPPAVLRADGREAVQGEMPAELIGQPRRQLRYSRRLM